MRESWRSQRLGNALRRHDWTGSQPVIFRLTLALPAGLIFAGGSFVLSFLPYRWRSVARPQAASQGSAAETSSTPAVPSFRHSIRRFLRALLPMPWPRRTATGLRLDSLPASQRQRQRQSRHARRQPDSHIVRRLLDSSSHKCLTVAAAPAEQIDLVRKWIDEVRRDRLERTGSRRQRRSMM